jgi:hypothetical protein
LEEASEPQVVGAAESGRAGQAQAAELAEELGWLPEPELELEQLSHQSKA